MVEASLNVGGALATSWYPRPAGNDTSLSGENPEKRYEPGGPSIERLELQFDVEFKHTPDFSQGLRGTPLAGIPSGQNNANSIGGNNLILREGFYFARLRLGDGGTPDATASADDTYVEGKVGLVDTGFGNEGISQEKNPMLSRSPEFLHIPFGHRGAQVSVTTPLSQDTTGTPWVGQITGGVFVGEYFNPWRPPSLYLTFNFTKGDTSLGMNLHQGNPRPGDDKLETMAEVVVQGRIPTSQLYLDKILWNLAGMYGIDGADRRGAISLRQTIDMTDYWQGAFREDFANDPDGKWGGAAGALTYRIFGDGAANVRVGVEGRWDRLPGNKNQFTTGLQVVAYDPGLLAL